MRLLAYELRGHKLSAMTIRNNRLRVSATKLLGLLSVVKFTLPSLLLKMAILSIYREVNFSLQVIRALCG